MTKEEVLQGALALNDENKKYIVTVEENKIIIQSKYYATPTHTRTGTFRCIARLNDDNTYVETHSDNNGRRMQCGKVAKVEKSITFTFGGKNDAVEVEKDEFNSEDIKKILRDYLDRCGYKRTNRGFWKRLFGK